jgi:hypothetical protein
MSRAIFNADRPEGAGRKYVASQVIAIFVGLDCSISQRLQRIFGSFRAAPVNVEYPGFRKASTLG